MNIASNGIRHAKSMIEIAVTSKLGFAHIVIKDDGDGISQEDLPHIFDRFYKGRDGNTGLGLSIAKSAIDFLGGELKAQNWDKGAEFIIIIPIKSQ
jgi:signal transduction histidine kinase